MRFPKFDALGSNKKYSLEIPKTCECGVDKPRENKNAHWGAISPPAPYSGKNKRRGSRGFKNN